MALYLHVIYINKMKYQIAIKDRENQHVKQKMPNSYIIIHEEREKT